MSMLSAPLRRYLAWVGIVSLISGCALNPPPSRYSVEQDFAPDVDLDLSTVPDAVPRHEPPALTGNKSPYRVRGKTYHVLNSASGYKTRGVASWYGGKFHGHSTSSGEIFNMFEMTAAHKSLPLPTYVRVTNLNNQRSVVVRVNDRGPFIDGRDIDLSYAAAFRLDMLKSGTAPVLIEALEVPGAKPFQQFSQDLPPGWGYFVQLGAFKNNQAANRLRQRVASKVTTPVKVVAPPGNSGDAISRVWAGPFTSEQAAQQVQQQLAQAGFGELLIITRPL